MPPQVIDKGICDPGLLAHVVLPKYPENRPLYQAEKEVARFGLKITRTTLADWVNAAATVLEHLHRRVRQDLMGGSYLQIKETPVQVIGPEVEGRGNRLVLVVCPPRLWGDLRLPEESWSGWSGSDAPVIHGNPSK